MKKLCPILLMLFASACKSTKHLKHQKIEDVHVIETRIELVKPVEVNLPTKEVYRTYEVEIKPEPVCGMAEFLQTFKNRFNVTNITDTMVKKVYVSVVFDTEGNFTNIKLLRNVDHSISEEVVTVLQKMEPWLPGLKDGKRVKVLHDLALPIVK